MPEFFVPFVDQDKQEEAYTELARLVGAAIRTTGSRVYSMVWRHDGVTWTATVGEKLKGIETVTKGRGRNQTSIDVPRSTDDTVMAIFPGSPGFIVHDNKSKIWNMPIMTGPAILVRLF